MDDKTNDHTRIEQYLILIQIFPKRLSHHILQKIHNSLLLVHAHLMIHINIGRVRAVQLVLKNMTTHFLSNPHHLTIHSYFTFRFHSQPIRDCYIFYQDPAHFIKYLKIIAPIFQTLLLSDFLIFVVFRLLNEHLD